MLRTFSTLLITLGFVIIIFYLGRETKKVSCKKENKRTSQLSLEQNFDRMFKDKSVWNSYDISRVKKIYKVNDLDNINVTL